MLMIHENHATDNESTEASSTDSNSNLKSNPKKRAFSTKKSTSTTSLSLKLTKLNHSTSSIQSDYSFQLQYPQMLFDAMNSGEFAFVESFLRSFCIDECKIRYYEKKSNEPVTANTRMIGYVDNLEMTIAALKQSMQSWPDCLWKSTSVKVRKSSDGQASIACGYSFSGTRIYLPEPVKDEFGAVKKFREKFIPLLIHDTEDGSIDPRLHAVGTLTMKLTPDGRITALEYYYCYLHIPKHTILNWNDVEEKA